MSSTSRPQANAKTNMQQGQSPAKPSQVESTNQLPNVQFNSQFNPNNIPVINPAQQLQIQSQLSNIQQTAAFFQRQSQLMQQQQQQQQIQQQQQQQQSNTMQNQQQPQPNSVESQSKNQPLSNGPLSSFHSFPELFNFFLMSNPNLNIPLPQINPTQTPVQQAPKTVPISPSKSGQSQHTPRSATTGSRSLGANINNAQTAELNNTTVTPATPSTKPSDQNIEIPKQLSTVSPSKSAASLSTVSTPSSTISERLLDEVKERSNALLQASNRNSHDDSSALTNNTTPPKAIGSSPEATKSPVPRRKLTNVTGPIKASPTVSPSNPAVQSNPLTFSTPKKSEDVKSATNSPSTPAAAIISLVSVPTTPATPPTPTTPPNKKVEPIKKEVQKSPKKNEEEVKTPLVTGNEKPTTSAVKAGAPSSSTGRELLKVPELNDAEIKSKRNRVKTDLYQSPTPEIVLATKMSLSDNSASSKDKLIIFFADEFLAVRNDEGSFYLCQCGHNMYRTSKKCRVRWLNEEDNSDGTYKLTFYDNIDKECILTSVSLDSVAGNSYKLTGNERERIDNILKKSIDVEKGLLPRPKVTEENPDGLDISLYNDESQIKTDEPVPASHKRKSESSSKLASPAKKAKQQTKTSKAPSPSRRKTNNSSSVELSKRSKKRSKQSKKNAQRRSNAVKSTTSSPSNESNTEAGRKKVAKTKKQEKSAASSPAVSSSSSTVGPERTLRKRSKN